MKNKNPKNNTKLQPDWWSKTFAGLFLGLAFAIAIGCVISLFSMGHTERALVPQVGMWSMPWIWMTLFFLAYFFPKGWQAILSYSLANVLAYSCLFLLQG